MKIMPSETHHLLLIFRIRIIRMIHNPMLCLVLPLIRRVTRARIIIKANGTALLERQAFGGIIDDGQGHGKRQDGGTGKDAEDLARDGFLAEFLEGGEEGV